MVAPLAAVQIALNQVSLIQQGVDPSAGGGVAGAIGSFFLRSGTGQAWLKTGVSNTAWQKLVQSFAWYSVKDYGATGDGVTDDTAAVQNASTACATAGGGVVFFPPGTYALTQVTINAQDNVQWLGSGTASILKWVWNAATAAGSMITLENGSDHCRFSLLRFDGSGLTNPAASRNNHLLRVDGGAGGVIETHVFQCQFGNMAAASGDGIHVVGSTGNLVSRLWIVDNMFDGCSRYSVGVEQGLEYCWVESNYLTNCETEIAVVSTASAIVNALTIFKNQIAHTSGSVRHAVRLEGDATLFLTKLVCVGNTALGGFWSIQNVQMGTVLENIATSGDYASTDGAWRLFDAVTQLTLCDNLIDRTSGTSVGPCLEISKVVSSPTFVRVGGNLLINEKTGGGFVSLLDVTQCSVGGNLCKSTNAGTSTMYGIEAQAATVNITDVLIGPANQMTAAAGSMAAGVHLLANGANVHDVSVVGNQGTDCDYGLANEVGGGGGVFDGQLLYAGNNFDSAVGDIDNIAVTPITRIGFNAGASGANLFVGNGSPNNVIAAVVGSMYLNLSGGQATTVWYKESGTGNTGWVAIGGSQFIFGAGDMTTGATEVFLAPGWIATATATEVQFAITRPGNVRNLRVQVVVAGTDSATVTYTIRKNGSDTALTTSLDNNSTGQATDTVDVVAVVAGDLLSLGSTKSGSVTAGQTFVTGSAEFL